MCILYSYRYGTIANMQRLGIHPSTFRLGCNFILKRWNHHEENGQNKATEYEQRDPVLICQRWEEAIIHEHRTADLPIEIMQERTIDTVTKIHIKQNVINQ